MAEWRVCVSGEIDLATAPELLRALREAINAPPAPVIVDCSGMTFIDSSGLRSLVEAKQLLEEQGRGSDFQMVNLAEMPRRAIELCGLAETLNIEAMLRS